jgi:AcrR family transcriptional regulator
MKVAATKVENADPKRLRVLEGALKVFLAYGFARTTMDDIARAADMSRPALYLLFRNKSEIYRAIAATMLEDSLLKADRALASQGAFGERLMKMVDDCLIAMMRMIAASPHGAEMVEMKGSLAGDLAADWRHRLAARLTLAIDEEAARNGAGLQSSGVSAKALADMLLDGLQGMKARTPDPDCQRRGAQALVAIVEIVLGLSGTAHRS